MNGHKPADRLAIAGVVVAAGVSYAARRLAEPKVASGRGGDDGDDD